MAGKVLAFRHIPFEHLGRIAESLPVEYDYVDLFDGAPVPDITDAPALIFMGGPMSANDDLPYIREELDLIRQAVSLGKPILGVCLGSQLIAKALGAQVYANHAKEIGWYPIYWNNAPDRPDTVFHWHGETFDLPPGAELLASSDLCRNQAFRIGKNILGLQFHLEVTPGMIADWLTQDANCGDLREITTPIDPQASAARLKELASRVFGEWCETIPAAEASALEQKARLPE